MVSTNAKQLNSNYGYIKIQAQNNYRDYRIICADLIILYITIKYVWTNYQ